MQLIIAVFIFLCVFTDRGWEWHYRSVATYRININWCKLNSISCIYACNVFRVYWFSLLCMEIIYQLKFWFINKNNIKVSIILLQAFPFGSYLNDNFNNIDFVCGGVQYGGLLCKLDLGISCPIYMSKKLLILYGSWGWGH